MLRTHRAMFVNNGWWIADTRGASPLDTDVISQFLSAYIPIVCSTLLLFFLGLRD